jgi:hypothetical protein
MHKIEIVTFIEVNKNFLSLEAILTLLATFIIEWRTTFQLEVGENKVVIFFPIQVHEPQVKKWLSKRLGVLASQNILLHKANYLNFSL